VPEDVTPGLMQPSITPTPMLPPSVRLLERIKGSCVHDLRTPLGAIVNYAAVLEASPDPGNEEVRELARRIRDNAQRIGGMLRSILQATDLATAAPRRAVIDLLDLARAELAAAGGRGEVRLSKDTGTSLAELDGDALAFAWRSYLGVACEAPVGPPLELEVRIRLAPGLLALGLCCIREPGLAGTVTAPEGSPLDLQAFLRQGKGPSHLENALALSLAEDLLVSRGATFALWGEAAGSSVLELTFPVAP
jgi:signal transduction histidine kinase